jgi:transcriptional regulator with XRE-family HTH domain
MTKFSKSNWLPMKFVENLSIVGEQLRLARLRRDLSIEQVAERAQCSRLTVAKLEKGLPTVSVGILCRILYALQLGDDILLLARDDKLGHVIQDIEVKNKKRASKK